MRNLVIYILGAAALLAVLVFVAGGGLRRAEQTASAGVLLAEEREVDFGTVPMGNGTVTRRFSVQNIGAEPLLINNVYTSCMCTTAYVEDTAGKRYGVFGMPGHQARASANIAVGAGKRVFVDAVFDPAAHGPARVGFAERSIYLETNAQKSPKVELRFTAIVTK